MRRYVKKVLKVEACADQSKGRGSDLHPLKNHKLVFHKNSKWTTGKMLDPPPGEVFWTKIPGPAHEKTSRRQYTA